MTDTPLHELSNNYNSKARNKVKEALHGTVSVNKRLSEQHVITEPETTRAEIDKEIFEKMSKIQDILSKSAQSNYLKQLYVAKTSELHLLKQNLKESVNAVQEEDIVNDIIGGK